MNTSIREARHMTEYIERLVAAAPPLTAEQVRRLRMLLLVHDAATRTPAPRQVGEDVTARRRPR